MSIEAMNWVLGARHQGVPPLTGPTDSKRLVLLALANHANDDGWAWPGLATICAEANVTERTAKAALRWLVEEGYLTENVQGSPVEFVARPQYRKNLYRLCFDVEAKDDLGGANRVSQGVQIASSRGCKSRQSDEGTPIALNHTQNHEGKPLVRPPAAPAFEGLGVDDLFEKFWTSYPRKVGKTGRNGHGARAAFRAALKLHGLDALSAGTKAWTRYWQQAGTAVTFIPHPSTFLNQARYLETPPPIVARPGGVLDQLAAIEFDGDGNMVSDPSAQRG